MALAEVLDLLTTDGLPLCPACSDPIEPGAPHEECERDAVLVLALVR